MEKRNIWLHAGIVVAMLAVACVFFSPVLNGKKMYQGDIQKYEAMVKETKDYHEATGDYALWNSAMFSGMPVYQVGGNAPMKSLFAPLRKLVSLEYFGVDRTIGVLFLYLLGFYLALLVLGCSPWVALLGALGFGLGSYNIIIVEAGHVSKALALGMMAPILAGMVRCMRRPSEGVAKWRDWLWGSLLFTLALGLQLNFNHIQITYYTLIGAVLVGVVYAVYSIKERYFPRFLAAVGVLLVGAALAFGGNARALMVSQQYTQYTMRGGNAISINPDGTPKDKGQNGLDIDYAYSWSYGVGETYTLLVPGAMGGGSAEKVDKSSASYKAFRQEQMPLYWGDQPFTSGPVYFGAIIVFLALLGAILVKGPERWWLLAGTLVAILLSWGRNLMPLNEWFFHHLPFYSKFRTPSMALVLANVCMVILAMLGLRQLLSAEVSGKRKNIALYVSGGITAVVLLVGLLLCGGFSFSGVSDMQMAAQYGDQWGRIQDVFVRDRHSLFVADTWRSMLFVLLAFAALWLYVNKMKGQARWQPIAVVAVLAVLTLVDLWGVDRRYVDDKDYVSANQLKLRPDPWDATIDEQAARFGDSDYRVLNLAVNTYNDSHPAAFHHQVGGYSAVKMRRYQDLIDFYLSSRISPQVLNMLNARYVVLQGGQVQRNPDALGNAWFVDEVRWVDDADSEILALAELDPVTTAVVNRTEFGASLDGFVPTADSTATIAMEHQHPYNPDLLRYRTHANSPQLAVFSEVYYAPDWRLYIDGEKADYIQADYLLRAALIPAGDHMVEFRNDAPLYHRMNIVTILASVIILLLAGGGIVLCYRRKQAE